MKTLTTVSPVTNKLAAVVSRQVFFIQSAKVPLKRITNSSVPVQKRDSSIPAQSRTDSSEVTVPEQLERQPQLTRREITSLCVTDL
jgi:hypothetical protein